MNGKATGIALGVFMAWALAARVAVADCMDPSCPKEVSQAMAASGTRYPLVLSVGLRSLSYFPSSHDRFDGSVQTSPAGYQFTGDALGDSAVRAYGAELGLDWAFSSFFYAGAAAAWGEGAWSAPSFTTGAMTIDPRATVNAHMWLTGARAGVRLPLGPLSVRGELLGGAEWVSLQQYASIAQSTMTANASTVTWLLEPRLAVDLWTTPFTAVSVFAAMPGFDSRAANGGILFAVHLRSFDGRYVGVL
ncbi:MAG TPA: hypothetical protein VHS09_11090 [Polyangiaceae bacterium]|jgi:hypothetical protein|nr:hypothetical protein [Polyangiaceae bacterium]